MSLSYFWYLQYDVRVDQDWSKERLRKGGQLRQQTRHQQVGRQVVGGHQLNLFQQEVEEGTWNIRITIMWKDKAFAIPAMAHWLGRCRLHLLCPLSFISNLFWRLSNKLMQLVAGCVMEGSMVFCQKNILGYSMMFHGDYKKRCPLTIVVSQIL